MLGTALAALIENSGYLSPGPPNYHGESSGASQNQAVMSKLLPNAEAQTALGWSAFNQGDVDRAVKLATTAVEMDPGGTQAHLLLVYAYTRLGDLGHAGSSWRELKQSYLKQR
ncbi:MAG: tetratricopeptide repeat protein [Gammaproteobacteria bacterium]